jgi:hypothetical protein
MSGRQKEVWKGRKNAGHFSLAIVNGTRLVRKCGDKLSEVGDIIWR